MTGPTKRYQVWQHSGEGFYFDEFDTLTECLNHLLTGCLIGRVFVTELKNLSLVIGAEAE